MKGFKLYKKSLYFGDKRIFKFTSDYIKKITHKLLWFFVLLVLFLTMIFGGLAIVIGTPQTTIQTVPNSISL